MGLGVMVKPRDMMTKEILHNTFAFSMLRPVVAVPERKLNYSFMAAEALWILAGDNRVDSISPYNKNIAQFSDNGETFFGAYGPKFVEQLPHVVGSLIEDSSSRQAVMTFWRESPPKTKDVPCTVALAFNVRDGRLNCHVYMRSSDAWLGVPYDVFNFTMIAIQVLALYNGAKSENVKLGNLFLTAVSAHLYQRNWTDALSCLTFDPSNALDTPLPDVPYGSVETNDVFKALHACREKQERLGGWRVRPLKD